MARSAEKANSLMNRFVEMQRAQAIGFHHRRPMRTADVTKVAEGEKWRAEILNDISAKITAIQNPYLGEVRIRQLNDQINELMREKRRWERRIIELGGPNYFKISQLKAYDRDGNELPSIETGAGTYKYFGEARNLPGVKEMLERESVENIIPATKEKNLAKRHVDPFYYGFDDEDEDLLAAEKAAEEAAMQSVEDKWVEDRLKTLGDKKELGFDVETELAELENGPKGALDSEMYDTWVFEAVNPFYTLPEEEQTDVVEEEIAEKEEEKDEAQSDDLLAALEQKKKELLARMGAL